MAPIGMQGTFDATAWARLFKALGIYDEVTTGLLVALAAGTRELSVGAGTAGTSGVYEPNLAATSVTLTENISGNPRIDVVAVEFDWTARTATVKVIRGTPASSPVPPALTRNEGVLWQVGLAQVHIAPNVGGGTIGTITDVRPGRRVPGALKVQTTLTADGLLGEYLKLTASRRVNALDYGRVTATTNVNSNVTVAHILGAAPVVALAIPLAVNGGRQMSHSASDDTASSIRFNVRDPAGVEVGNDVSMSFGWLAIR